MSKNVEKVVKDNMSEIIKSFNRSLKRKGLSGEISISAIHFIEPKSLVGKNCHEVNSCRRVQDPITGEWTTICTSEIKCN